MATLSAHITNMSEKYKTKAENIFALKGYIKLLGDYEEKSNVFQILSNIFYIGSAEGWKDCMPSTTHSALKSLFSCWRRNCDNIKSLDKTDLLKYMELFSLLENVFRNTLLRPFVPAYKTINMDCGQYCCCFKEQLTEDLFKKLHFSKQNNLLTYDEQDPQETICCAYTCTIFWFFLSMELLDRQSKSTK